MGMISCMLNVQVDSGFCIVDLVTVPRAVVFAVYSVCWGTLGSVPGIALRLSLRYMITQLLISLV